METKESYSIYIVEDNEMYSIMMDYLLTKYSNFHIKRFTTGEECVSSLNENPDIVVLDYILPGMSGLEVLKKIKEVSPQTRVIILSGQDDPEKAKEVLTLGVEEYLVKDQQAFKQVEDAIDRIILDIDQKVTSKSRKMRNLYIAVTSLLIIGVIGGIIAYKSIMAP